MDDKELKEAVDYVTKNINEDFLRKLSKEQFEEIEKLINKIDAKFNK